MAGARSHEELDVYQLSAEVQKRVLELLKTPAIRADFDLYNQLGEAGNSICSNIAEGFSRYHPRENARFVRVAKGSLSEVIEHLRTAVAKGYLKSETIADTCTFARRARGAATGYIVYLEGAEAPNVPRTAPRRPKRSHHARRKRQNRGTGT
jgi:four helix bundle protein